MPPALATKLLPHKGHAWLQVKEEVRGDYSSISHCFLPAAGAGLWPPASTGSGGDWAPGCSTLDV